MIEETAMRLIVELVIVIASTFSAVVGAVVGMSRVMASQREVMQRQIDALQQQNSKLQSELFTLRSIVYQKFGLQLPNE